MFDLLRSLARNRRLLRDFVRRDLKGRYVGSSMGFFWSVIFPIVNLAIYSFVFRIVIRMRWDDHMPTEEVLLLMFAGILVWVSFAESVSRMTNSLVENGNLIQKVVFPSEVLAPYLTVSALVNMCLGLPVVLAGVAWFGYVSPARVDPDAPPPLIDYRQASGPAAEPASEAAAAPAPGDVPAAGAGAGPAEEQASDGSRRRFGLWDPPIPGLGDPAIPGLADPAAGEASRPELDKDAIAPVRHLAFGIGLLALPLLILLQGLFAVGVGYFLSTLNLFLRDTYHLVGVFLTVWMFATPIFYPAVLVSGRGYGWMLAFNPMYWLIEAYRDVLLYGAWPDWTGIGLFTLVAGGFFGLGASFFRAQRDRFPDLL